MLSLNLNHVSATEVALLLATLLTSAQIFPTVDLGYAQYQGTVDAATNITNFLGIRYAAVPLGDLRFRAPQAPVNVTGIHPATVQPNDECMPASPGLSPTNPFESRATAVNTSEDCLFLNIYYPSNEMGVPVRDLPTVVWIHGGAYISGAASSYLGVEYNGEDIIRQSNHGVVVAAIQYQYDIENTEMLFNMTDAGEPVVEPISTSDALLERCHVGNLTGQ